MADAAERAAELGGFADVPSGIHPIGHDGDGFCFDNEAAAASRRSCSRSRIARTLVTQCANGSTSSPTAAIATPSLWLSDGWALVRGEGWEAPGYWQKIDGAWFTMTLGGLRPVDPDAPVCTSAITKPTRSRAGPASVCPPKPNGKSPRARGTAGRCFRRRSGNGRTARIRPIRVIAPLEGALGEYNGKFMVNQIVLARQLAGDARRAMRARAIAISSIRRRAGNSAGCGWRTMAIDAVAAI